MQLPAEPPQSVRRPFGRRVWPIMLVSSLALLVQACASTVPSPGGTLPSEKGGEANLAASGKSRETSPSVSEADLAEVISGDSAFAFDVYRELRGMEGNLFLSPHSISTALAMTYAGARGETEREMASVLHYTLPQDRLHPGFNALDLELASRAEALETQEGEPFKLHIVNALWGQKGYSFLPAFLDLLALDYGAGMRLMDFATAPEESRQVINNWVSDETEEKIKDLIPQGCIDTSTRLVLTNAIYFNAGWLHPFEEASTQDGAFTLLDGSEVTVPMMSETAALSYGEKGGVQVIEMPYVGDKVAMDIILPGAGEFGAVEGSLTAEGITELLGVLAPQSVSLTMPKFKFESSFDQLAGTLAGMGMPDAICGGDTDFSGMDGSRNLCIGAVVHKAFVSVDEKGTEAAAATAVVMLETAMMEGVEVRVDRPFLFLIRDRDTGAILFLGRMLNPAG